jgi:hypothetical protein
MNLNVKSQEVIFILFQTCIFHISKNSYILVQYPILYSKLNAYYFTGPGKEGKSTFTWL